MGRRTTILCLLTLAAIVGSNRDLGAGKFNRQLSVGDAAPAWENLPGVDGKSHSLSDCKNAKAVVVIFVCNHCPVSAAYEGRFKQFVTEMRECDVKLVAISISQHGSDTLEKMKVRATDQGFNFSYLHDRSQGIGKCYGATMTPQVFVLDGHRQVAYMGLWDDNWKDESRVEISFVRDAVESVLAGRLPEIRETRPTGCAIEYVDSKQGPRE